MRIFKSVGALSVACAAAIASTGCNLDVKNPTVIDAATFNPNADGTTLALSAQTNFYIAFQSVALYAGLISDELWTGAARLQTKRLAARVFASTDDINADFHARSEERRVGKECSSEWTALRYRKICID